MLTGVSGHAAVRTRLAALLLALLGLAGVAAAEEVEERLAQLSSASVGERRRAQGWLTANLRARDYAAIAGVVERRGDSEFGSRLVEALSGDDRHLELAVLLACDEEPRLAELGRSVIAELARVWTRAVEPAGSPLRGELVLERLAGSAPDRFQLEAGREPTAAELHRLARVARPELAIVIDPGLDPEVDRGQRGALDPLPELVSGTWHEILGSLTRVHGVALEGFAFGPRSEGGARAAERAWIRVCRSGDEDRATAVELWTEWCRDLHSYPDTPRGAACGRALAACGWPAALAWLEERWIERDDANALAGLLLAAERGRVAPALARRALFERLLAQADRDLLVGDPLSLARAESTARGLAAVGLAGPAGDELCKRTLAGWSSLSHGSRTVRAIVLENQSCRLEEAAEALGSWVGAGSGPDGPQPLQRFQALRALARGAADRPPPELRAAAELLVWAARTARLAACLDLLTELGVRPPASWRTPAGLPPGWSAELRLAVLEWWTYAGASEVAVVHLRALLDPASGVSEAALVDRLRVWTRREGRQWVERLLSEVRARVGGAEAGAREGAALDRLALFAGCLADAEQLRLLARSMESWPSSADEYRLLGALSASSRGAVAREGLIESYSQADGETRERMVVPGVVCALEALRERRMRGAERELLEALRGLGASPESWPAPAPGPLRDLRAEDRVLLD